MRIIEVIESTTDPVALERKWLEITEMLSEGRDKPSAGASNGSSLRSKRRHDRNLERKKVSQRCLVGAG